MSKHTEKVLKWCGNTVSFTHTSHGMAINEESMWRVIGDKVIYDMVDDSQCLIDPDLRLMIVRTLELIGEISNDNPTHSIESETRDVVDIDNQQTSSVMTWILNSLALVNEINDDTYNMRTLMTEADEKIVRPVQGNRYKSPTIADLDLIVQKAIKVLCDKVNVTA